MTGRQGASSFVGANWPALAGIPRPDVGKWMMRETCLDLSTLRSLESRSLIEKAGEKKVQGDRTGRETMQMQWRTKRQGGVYDWFDSRCDLPKRLFQRVAIDPIADVTIVDVTGDAGRTRELAAEVEELLMLDVQVIELDVRGRASRGLFDVDKLLRVVPDAGVVVTDEALFGAVNERVDAGSLSIDPRSVEFRRACGSEAFAPLTGSEQSFSAPERSHAPGQRTLTGETVVPDGGTEGNTGNEEQSLFEKIKAARVDDNDGEGSGPGETVQIPEDQVTFGLGDDDGDDWSHPHSHASS